MGASLRDVAGPEAALEDTSQPVRLRFENARFASAAAAAAVRARGAFDEFGRRRRDGRPLLTMQSRETSATRVLTVGLEVGWRAEGGESQCNHTAAWERAYLPTYLPTFLPVSKGPGRPPRPGQCNHSMGASLRGRAYHLVRAYHLAPGLKSRRHSRAHEHLTSFTRDVEQAAAAAAAEEAPPSPEDSEVLCSGGQRAGASVTKDRRP